MLQKYKDVTNPAVEPVTLAELKAHLRITESAEDAYLTTLIVVARVTLESITRRTIARRTVQLFMDFFPCNHDEWWDGVRDGSMTELNGRGNFFTIPRPPLVSVQSIKTYDDADASATFSASNYYVDTASDNLLGRVALRSGGVWPTALRTRNAVEVNYTAGYADGLVPAPLKHAILVLAAHAYANRGDCSEECASACGASMLASPYIMRQVA
jgi:hypothetical protein